MKTPQELRIANAGQAAKFLEQSDQYTVAHLQAALINALRRIDALERRVNVINVGTERPGEDVDLSR